MENVQGKTAIITGGGRNIGYSITEELLRKGAKKIAIIDLPMSRGQQAVTTLQGKFGKERVVYFPCDVTKTEDFKETFKEIVKVFGGLDILVNNAGFLNDNLVKETINTNAVAQIRGSLMALDYMGKHKGGKGGTIVNIASAGGVRFVLPLPVYCASKFAVVAFSRCLQTFYDKTNVRVLTLCPGYTNTEIAMGRTEIRVNLDFVDEEDVNKMRNNHIIQTCEYVGNTAVDFIQKGKNGTILLVEDNQPEFAIEILEYVRK